MSVPGLIAKHAQSFDDLDEVDPLLRSIGDARVVLVGEASHGISEFYRLGPVLRICPVCVILADWPAHFSLTS